MKLYEPQFSFLSFFLAVFLDSFSELFCLFSQLDKVYDSKNSPDEDDPIERQEEMNRMREHVFKEIDKDKNFRITLQEFIDYTGSVGENEKFKEDEGWKVSG